MFVRDDVPADHASIHALVAAAFGRAGEALLVDRLREAREGVISLVAVDGDEIVGHVMLSRMTAPFEALGLAPLSVRPERQGAGVGSLLVRESLERARRGGWDAVFVLGDPAYYGRFGFDAAVARGFASPFAGPHLMAIALDGALPVTSGSVDYVPAFGDL